MKQSIKLLISILGLIIIISGLAIAATLNLSGNTTGKEDKTKDKTLSDKLIDKINIDKTTKELAEKKVETTKDKVDIKINKITSKGQLNIVEYTDNVESRDYILITGSVK